MNPENQRTMENVWSFRRRATAGWVRWLGCRNFNTLVATAGILHKGLRRFHANHYYKVSVILLPSTDVPGEYLFSLAAMAVTRCAQIYPSRLEDFQFRYVSRSSLTIKSCRFPYTSGFTRTNRLILRRSMRHETTFLFENRRLPTECCSFVA